MMIYPEWFIGGPLDGKSKYDVFPAIPEWWTIRATEYTGDAIITYEEHLIRPLDIEWAYSQDHFVFGGIRVPFWTDYRYMSREVVSCRLAELIMAPHVKENREVGSEKVNLVKGAKP